MKRVGEKGEGQFEEVSWDVALNDIAARLKDIVQKNGESSVVSTSHSFSSFSKWLTFPLGSPNNIGHQSSCNAGGIAGRHLVFGKGFDGAGKMEPDYANLRYLILIGRSMGAAMGALHTLNEARAQGAKVVAIDPRMPDISYGDADWIPIRPGTDGAFVAALINEMISQGTADFSFIEKHTNGAYLIKENGEPLTQGEIKPNGSKSLYVVMDSKGNLSFRGVKKDAKGNVVGFEEDPSFKSDINAGSTVQLVDGTVIPVKTAFAILKEKVAEFTPEKASELTGIDADQIRLVAK